MQKLSTFAEGNKTSGAGDGGRIHATARWRRRAEAGRIERSDAFVGTNVFVLFDTSNYMYRGFVYASDAIADFVRGLDRADSVAVYTYSRNLSRAASLSRDRNDAIIGLAQGRGGRRFGAVQRSAADPARCGESAGTQSRDRVLERSGQREHGRS